MDIYVMIVSIIIVLLLLVGFIVAFLLIYRNRQIRSELAFKQAEEQYHREVLKAELESKENTLRTISEEIHDNVGQVLSLAILHLSNIDLQDTENAGRKLESITGLVKKAVGDLRHLSKTLDAENLVRAGLPAILQFELERLEGSGAFATSFKLAGPEQRLDPYHEIVIYRLAQEALQNVIKHAQATQVSIMMAFEPGQLVLHITDNGRGFTPSAQRADNLHKQGAGLDNMRRRAALINAGIQWISAPAQGTRVSLTLPLPSYERI